MDSGAQMLLRILGVALVLGLIVVFAHPDYRNTARAMFRGEVESSAIWRSNAEYYSEVSYEPIAEPEPRP
ncbi:MAG: hypothetical protein KBA51_05875 [Kiritimatiellae bacterium]|nr:hypothetical protein [Kiritimatiellia bacterium]